MKLVEKIRVLLLKCNYIKSAELITGIIDSVDNNSTERVGINNHMRSYLSDLISNPNMIMYLLENEEDDLIYIGHFEKYIIPILLKG